MNRSMIFLIGYFVALAMFPAVLAWDPVYYTHFVGYEEPIPEGSDYFYVNDSISIEVSVSNHTAICEEYSYGWPPEDGYWTYQQAGTAYQKEYGDDSVELNWSDYSYAPYHGGYLYIGVRCAGYAPVTYGYLEINATCERPPTSPPVAGFTFSPASGNAPLLANFTDTSTNATSWSWSFGDGDVSTDQHPQHTYEFSGDFLVNLTASNYLGYDSAEAWINVSSGAQAPVADFEATPVNGVRPLTVQFNDTSTRSPTEWIWVFGDGGGSSAQNPVHEYLLTGTYTVSLNVTNAGGSHIEEKVDYITVETPMYSMTNVEGYYPAFLQNLSNATMNPPYYPGRAIYTNISGRLQNDGWQSAFIHNDFEVTKIDFGTTGEGVNDATFHYHFGHGNTTHALLFSGYIPYCVGGQPPVCWDPSDSIHPSEMQWNGDLKWILLDACSTLENQDWAQPMGTTHGVLGFESLKMPSQDLPNLFLHYALDENYTVFTAYRNATFGSFTENVTAAVIFSNDEQKQNDHFPGHGPIMPDEYPNNHANDNYPDPWNCGGGPTDDKYYG